jgi:hypothetical protein
MLIRCTKKLLTELKITPTEVEEVNPLFSWHANVLLLNRRKVVVLVNDLTQYPIVLYGLKAKDFKNISEVAVAAIRETFKAEGIKEEVIAHYFAQADEQVHITKTLDRTLVARMNKSCETVTFFDELMVEDSIVQPAWSMRVSKFMVGRPVVRYVYPNKELYEALATLSEQSTFDGSAVVLNVTLRLDNHKVRRRIVVPLNKTFSELHTILQTAFGWGNCHLYDFTIFGNKSTNTGSPIVKLVCNEESLHYSSGVEQKLDHDVELSEYMSPGINILYIYDFGDDWYHDIEVERLVDNHAVNYAICLDGEGDTPPEDVGGEPGYDEYLSVLAQPSHPEYAYTKSWGESQRSLPFSLNMVNGDLK